MKQRKRMTASLTVEAAFIYPYLLLITFLLVKLTVYRYLAVQKSAADLYDAVVAKQGITATERLRLSDTAFDLFDK